MKRTALLISCSQQELDEIRRCAEAEHRQISSYVLSVLMPMIAFEEELLTRYVHLRDLSLTIGHAPHLHPRNVMLLRCSADEARRIRGAVVRRNATISGYVLFALHRRWQLIRGGKKRRDKSAPPPFVA
jgi:hypothetical protein